MRMAENFRDFAQRGAKNATRCDSMGYWEIQGVSAAPMGGFGAGFGVTFGGGFGASPERTPSPRSARLYWSVGMRKACQTAQVARKKAVGVRLTGASFPISNRETPEGEISNPTFDVRRDFECNLRLKVTFRKAPSRRKARRQPSFQKTDGRGVATFQPRAMPLTLSVRWR
jgi:hypothetical protein